MKISRIIEQVKYTTLCESCSLWSFFSGSTNLRANWFHSWTVLSRWFTQIHWHQSSDISRILFIDRMILPPAGISCLKNRISYLIMRKYPHAQQNCSLHMFWRLNNDYNFRVLRAGIHPFFVIIKHKLVPHLNSFLLVGPKWIFSNLTFNFECDLF